MKNMKMLATAVMLCVVGGSAAWAQDREDAKGARVRFLGQAAATLKYYKNQTCVSPRGGIVVQKPSLFRSGKVVSLGMPVTPNVTNLDSRSGILTSAAYKEYAVRAGEPLTVWGKYGETTGRSAYWCEEIALVFNPEQGQDYEVTFDFEQGGCKLNVRRIEVTGDQVQLQPVPTSAPHKCTANDVVPIEVCKATLAECKADALAKFRETSPDGKPGKTVYEECAAEYKACAAETK